MKTLSMILSGVLLIESSTHGAEADRFEVAVIKYHDFQNGRDTRPPGVSILGNKVTAFNLALSGLVIYAYGVEAFQVAGGPGWAKNQFDASFDITAETEGDRPPTVDQVRKMFQTLLAERFKLKLHREMRDLPVYTLVLGKNARKLKASPTDSKYSAMQTPVGRQGIQMIAAHETMTQLANQLRIYVGRPILDRTGLTGTYDFTLEWSQPSPDAPDTAALDSSGPSIFTAVEEQLGLKLESQKSSTEILVIDDAEKPSGNE